jgi:hypothetical protein
MLMLTILLVIIAYAAWRVQLHRAAKARFVPQFPNARCLSWRAWTASQWQAGTRLEIPAGSDLARLLERAEARDRTSGVEDSTEAPEGVAPNSTIPTWAVGIDGALAGLSVAEAFGHVDPAVLNAIDFSTADHIHNLASVDSYVHDHFFASPDASAEGWLHRLEGYVAEQKAAVALEQAGHHVEFAHFSNQPDWDLIVDGHPLQIKEGVDAAHIKEFLAQHPDIQVLTGDDIASQIHDSHLQGIPELDHDAVASSTKDSLHGVKDGFHPGFHVPIVTLLLSSYREGKLLWNERTTIEKALKHVAIDVASVGAGAWVGAKTGAVLGSWAGPVGAGIGGFVGAVGGAIAGKFAANGIRYATFNQVRAEYCRTVDVAQENIQSRIEHSRGQVRELQAAFQGRFDCERKAIVAAADRALTSVHDESRRKMSDFADNFPGRLDDLLDQLKREEAEVLAQLPGSWFALIYPKERDLLRSLARSWFKRARRLVRDEKKAYLELPGHSQDARFRAIRTFLNNYDFELATLQADLDRLAASIGNARESAERIHREAIAKAEAVRTGLLKEFGATVADLHAQLADFIQGWNDRITECRERLRREGRPVGIEI